MMSMIGGVVVGPNPIINSNHLLLRTTTTQIRSDIKMMITTTNTNTSFINTTRGDSFCIPINNNNYNKKKKKKNTIILMQWQDCKVKMDVQVPVSVAYKCYSDREAIPKWMPFISTVKNLEDKPDLSRWSLKYNAFGQDIEFSWLARNMQPILNQKIHWRSLEGLPNRGAVRFYPKGPSSCTIELTVSYEVPQLLVPVASALQPFLESLLSRGLERFAEFASTYSTDSSS